MADSLIARLSTVPGWSFARSARCAATPAPSRTRCARRASSTWRGSSTARCSGVATSCASPRACCAAPTASPPGPAASTRNSPASSKCRTRSRRASRRSSRRASKPFAGAQLLGIGARRNTQHRRLPALSGRGSLRAGHARRRPAQEHRRCTARRWTSTPAMRWPGSGLPRRIGERCSAPTPSHRMRSSRRTRRSGTPCRRHPTWPKRVPSRRSGSTGSTSTGTVPSVGSGARSRAIRTWSRPASAWRPCSSTRAGRTKALRSCASRENSIRCHPYTTRSKPPTCSRRIVATRHVAG